MTHKERKDRLDVKRKLWLIEARPITKLVGQVLEPSTQTKNKQKFKQLLASANTEAIDSYLLPLLHPCKKFIESMLQISIVDYYSPTFF